MGWQFDLEKEKHGWNIRNGWKVLTWKRKTLSGKMFRVMTGASGGDQTWSWIWRSVVNYSFSLNNALFQGELLGLIVSLYGRIQSINC